MAVQPPDGTSISDETMLWRRIPLDPAHTTYDENLQRLRPSSAAFRDHRNGSSMSVILDRGQSPNEALRGHENFALAAISVGLVRKLNLGVVAAPLEREPNHAEVTGDKSKKISGELAKAAKWIVPPPSVGQG